MPRTDHRLPAPARVAAGARTLAAVAMHLLERQVAGIPARQQNPLDRRMADALTTAKITKAQLLRCVVHYKRMPTARRNELFDKALIDLPATTAIDIDRIRDIVDQLGPIDVLEPPSAPHPHEVTFSHLICDRQESLVGSDEPYIVFGIVTPGQLGLPAQVRTVTTPIYTEVDPGERRPTSGSQNLRLFGETGPALIDPDQPQVITATAFEHAPGQSAQAVAFAVAGALVIASSLLAEVTPVAAALLIAGVLTGLIAGLAFSERQLGDSTGLSISATDAEELTAATPLVTLPELNFRGYRAVLQLRRS